jgi:hypothetical protein
MNRRFASPEKLPGTADWTIAIRLGPPGLALRQTPLRRHACSVVSNPIPRRRCFRWISQPWACHDSVAHVERRASTFFAEDAIPAWGSPVDTRATWVPGCGEPKHVLRIYQIAKKARYALSARKNWTSPPWPRELRLRLFDGTCTRLDLACLPRRSRLDIDKNHPPPPNSLSILPPCLYRTVHGSRLPHHGSWHRSCVNSDAGRLFGPANQFLGRQADAFRPPAAALPRESFARFRRTGRCRIVPG